MFIFKDGDRIILSSPTDIEQHVRHFYSCLYEFDNACSPNDLIGKVIPSLVSEDDNASLTHLPSGDEIRAAVFSMNVAGARPWAKRLWWVLLSEILVYCGSGYV